MICLLLSPSDVVEFRDTIVWAKFYLAELAEGDVEEVEHPGVLGYWTFQSGKPVQYLLHEDQHQKMPSILQFLG